MLNLSKYAGFALEINDDYDLVFGEETADSEPERKDFRLNRNVFQRPEERFNRDYLYSVYRGIGKEEDLGNIAEAGLSFSITIIPPGLIGREWVKTVGYYPSKKKNLDLRYNEICEVVWGKAFCILQKPDESLTKLERVIAVSAVRGDKLVIPSGYGAVWINPDEEILAISKWQAREAKEEEESFLRNNGAAFYVMKTERLGSGGNMTESHEFAPNLSYNSLPRLEEARALELPQYDILHALPIYFSGIQNTGRLDFVVNPENYLEEIVPERLYKSRIHR